MIVNIRGTNGSGKSTIVKKFLDKSRPIELFGAFGFRRPEAYMVNVGSSCLYVIGPYLTATGGVDALPISSVDLVELLEKYRKKGHVIFEGVVISTYYGAVGEWLEKNKDDAVVVFLDTPLDVCLSSIAERASAKRGTQHVAGKVKAIASVEKRMSGAGILTKRLSRSDAYETIRGWLTRSAVSPQNGGKDV